MSLQKYDGKGAVAKFFRVKFYTAFTQCSEKWFVIVWKSVSCRNFTLTLHNGDFLQISAQSRGFFFGKKLLVRTRFRIGDGLRSGVEQDGGLAR